MPRQDAEKDEDEEKETSLQLMREEHLNVQQRIMTVETTVVQHDRRLAMVELTQTDLQKIIGTLAVSSEKATDLAHTLSQKTAINEMTIVAVKERTDQFADHMEKVVDSIVGKQEDTAKIVARHETKWGIMQAIGVAAIGVIATILASHLFHF